MFLFASEHGLEYDASCVKNYCGESENVAKRK